MTHVLDASALLAYVQEERGGDQVFLPGRLLHLSLVNYAEVLSTYAERGGSVADMEEVIGHLPIRLRRFREIQAGEIGRLRPLTRHLGLGLGDRACLALAVQTELPVLTADTKWAELDLGIDIRLIR